MLDEIAAQIWARPQFHEDYDRLLRRGLQDHLGINPTASDEIDEKTLQRLLQTAVHFAGSTDPKKKEAAYRIAISSWRIFDAHLGLSLQEVVHLILGRLGNFPAIDFLFRKHEDSRGQLLPGVMWLEISSHALENSVQVTDQQALTLTDFQRHLWEKLSSGQSLTVTAPTSAGKSYALQRFIGRRLLSAKDFIGLYIVPTRALIHQVSTALKQVFKNISNEDIPVLTIPVPPRESAMKRGVYVLTQERLQILLEAAPETEFSMVVVDEAQEVSADSRGIILQTVIDQLLGRGKPLQILFSSPTTANPDVFKKLFGLTKVERVDENESPVAQNFIFLDTDPIKRDQISIQARIALQKQPIGTVTLPTEIIEPKQSLAYLSWHFGKDEQNLIYAGSPAACEEVASMIADLEKARTDRSAAATAALQSLAGFLREHVHQNYLLASTVEQGVAFHYGQMPSIVRKTLEDYFDQGFLQYLVSTSTLLHGVNLPAKNLFLLDPTKGDEWLSGRDEPISPSEFWNLAGRAGRLGKEYEGNVFIVDHARWRSKPLESSVRQELVPAFEEHLKDKKKDLVYFIQDEEHPSGVKQGIESTFVKAFNDFRRGTLNRTMDSIYGPDSNEAQELTRTLNAIAEKISIPTEITERHVTISVFRQQEMFDYLLKKVTTEGPEPFIPLHPRADWDLAYESLWRLFKRIHSHFEKLPGKDRSHFYFAGLALRWMRGEPLPRLIDTAYDRRKKQAKRGSPSIGPVIRALMSEIDNDLGFRYVKYGRCYIDILQAVLRNTGNEEFIKRIPNIPLYLELGASSKTMVSLIGLGLSRTTAGILAEKSVNKELDTRAAEDWLKGKDFAAMGVPEICIHELEKIRRK